MNTRRVLVGFCLSLILPVAGFAAPADEQADGHEAAHTVQQPAAGPSTSNPAEVKTVKGSKSNTSERAAAAGGSETEATTVKSSKSNSSERQASPDDPQAAEVSNLNLSKSGVNREAGDEEPAPKESDG